MPLRNGSKDLCHVLSPVLVTMTPHELIKVAVELIAIHPTHPLELDLGIFPEALKGVA